MKQTLKKFKDGIIFGIGFLLVIGVVSAWENLGTVSSGQTLTVTVWNSMVTKLNETGNRVSGIFTDGSGNVGIGTSSPTEKLYVNGNIKTNGKVGVDMFFKNITLNSGTYSDSDVACTFNGTATDCTCIKQNYQIYSGGTYVSASDLFRESRPIGLNTWRIACNSNIAGFPTITCPGISVICSKVYAN